MVHIHGTQHTEAQPLDLNSCGHCTHAEARDNGVSSGGHRIVHMLVRLEFSWRFQRYWTPDATILESTAGRDDPVHAENACITCRCAVAPAWDLQRLRKLKQERVVYCLLKLPGLDETWRISTIYWACFLERSIWPNNRCSFNRISTIPKFMLVSF